MKTTKMLLGILICFSIITACKKSKRDEATPSVKPQNPFTADLASMTGFSNNIRKYGPWELGIVFRATVNGKITQLGCKMPQAGKYNVSIWDESTKEQIRVVAVDQTSVNELKMTNIEALELSASRKLIVSINTMDLNSTTFKPYFCLVSLTDSDFMPYTKGNIEIINTCYINSAEPKFPQGFINIKNELYGKPEITFVPN